MTRQDAWTKDEDLLLAETILRYIREGKTQLDAFKEVAKRLSRTPAACGFRWNSTIRKQYTDAIDHARAERKSGYFMKKKDQSFQSEVKEAISILTKVKRMKEISEEDIEEKNRHLIESIRRENKQLRRKLKRYEDAWKEMGKLWSWINDQAKI